MSEALPDGADYALPDDGQEDARLGLRVAFWGALAGTFLVDLVTKALAVATLVFWHPPRPVLGDVLRLSLAYNPGVAFGWNIGPWSRLVFSMLAVLVIAGLYRLYRATAAGDTSRALALGLICGGALGNLFDRIRSARGVVDFIDIGIGDARWWTFNLADVAVAIGAGILIRLMWSEEPLSHQLSADSDDAQPSAAS